METQRQKGIKRQEEKEGRRREKAAWCANSTCPSGSITLTQSQFQIDTDYEITTLSKDNQIKMGPDRRMKGPHVL